MTERRSCVLVIVGFLLAAGAAGVLGGILEEQTGQSWLRYVLLVVVVVPAVLVVGPMVIARGVQGDTRWYASSLRSTRSRVAWVGGILALEADAVTFQPHLGLGRTRRYPLETVTSVTGFATRPPRVRVDLRHDRPVAFAVFPKVRSSIWSQDTSARDEAVRAISSRLGRQR